MARGCELLGMLGEVAISQTGKHSLGCLPFVRCWVLAGIDIAAQRVGFAPCVAQ
jgi:hypothetical protein